MEGGESDGPADAVPYRRDRDGPAEFLGARQQIQCVKPVHIVGDGPGRNFLGLGHRIKGIGGKIDRGRIGYPQFGAYIRTRGYLLVGDGGHPGTQKADLPKGVGIGTRVVVRVESVDAVMLGADENHVVGRAIDVKVGNVKRLTKKISVHRMGENLAECGAVHVGGRQQGFVGIQPRAGSVVVPENHGILGLGGKGQKEENGKISQ